jgi:hypothetical protein
MGQVGAFFKWVGSWLTWPLTRVSEHIKIEAVVTLGVAITSGVVAYVQKQDPWHAVVVALVCGAGAMILLYLFGLVVAPYAMHQQMRMRAERAESFHRSREAVAKTVLVLREHTRQIPALERKIKRCRTPEDLKTQIIPAVINWMQRIHSQLSEFNQMYADKFGQPGDIMIKGNLEDSRDHVLRTLEKRQRLLEDVFDLVNLTFPTNGGHPTLPVSRSCSSRTRLG